MRLRITAPIGFRDKLRVRQPLPARPGQCSRTAGFAGSRIRRSQRRTNTAVNLTFHHALTAVKFVCGSDMKAGTVKSVTLKGVNSAGVYNLETGTWSNVGNPKNFSQTLNRSTSGALNAVITAPEQTFMMIPQTLPDGAVIEVIFNDGITDNILTGQIGNSEWQKGKTVTYQLSSTSINWQYTLAVSLRKHVF